jgi:glycolate oxidase
MIKIPLQFIHQLKQAIGEKYVYTDPERLEAYNFDGTEYRFIPDLVVEPETTEQISVLMKLASAYRIPVVPRGAATGLSGGALAIQGGVVLSFLRMDKILEIDEINMIAVVQPGVINLHLHEAIEARGLYYPPDPASYETSSIGGNIAEDAGGPHCYKYGTTRDYVLGLNVVLPDGTILNTGVKTRKGVVGYDLTNLIVGSEGTLAIVTEATLRLIPLPAKTVTLLAFFPDTNSLVASLSGITKSRIVPAALEFLDPACLNLIRDQISLSVPQESSSLLIIDLDGEAEELDRQIEIVGEICLENMAIDVLIAEGSERRKGLWDVRRKLRDLIKEGNKFKRAEDVTVPINKIPELIASCEKISRKFEFDNYNFGHLGDGNVHVNLTHRGKNDQIIKQGEQAAEQIFKLVLQLGGTISGEHGIGITKQPFLNLELSKRSIQLQQEIKKIFDPLNILNPGKIFPLSKLIAK